MFDLFEIEFIRSSTILVCLNNPIGQKKVIAISIFEMVLIYYNNKWKHRPTTRINTLDHSNPFPIIKLYSFNFSTPVVRYYNKNRYDLTHKNAYLVEIPNIGFYNTMLGNYILEKSKPNPNDL